MSDRFPRLRRVGQPGVSGVRRRDTLPQAGEDQVRLRHAFQIQDVQRLLNPVLFRIRAPRRRARDPLHGSPVRMPLQRAVLRETGEESRAQGKDRDGDARRWLGRWRGATGRQR